MKNSTTHPTQSKIDFYATRIMGGLVIAALLIAVIIAIYKITQGDVFIKGNL